MLAWCTVEWGCVVELREASGEGHLPDPPLHAGTARPPLSGRARAQGHTQLGRSQDPLTTQHLSAKCLVILPIPYNELYLHVGIYMLQYLTNL
jgi:hypothetical protein